MPHQRPVDIAHFFVAGINYKKTDAALRGQFAINNEQYSNILKLAPNYGLQELFIISTCNRTEIYGFVENANTLCQLLCTQTQGSIKIFNSIAYIKNSTNAIEHLFDVAAGLDSQILGDYEILGQLKQSISFSKEHNFIGTYLQRLTNAVLQSSKLIKTNTQLSSGTVSVAFAAIQFIKQHVQQVSDKKIVLIGTGKIGRNTCKNLVDYLNTKNITLINRTDTKAMALAHELDVKFASISDLSNQINEADIILVATNNDEPIILQSHLLNNRNKIIIDLSIPFNVEKSVAALKNITLINVDHLSKIKDETLEKRVAEIPKAKAIIKKQMDEFLLWHAMRKNAKILKAIKNKLQDINSSKSYSSYFTKPNLIAIGPDDSNYKIQKVIDGTAVKMRSQNQHGCHYITAINEFIETV